MLGSKITNQDEEEVEEELAALEAELAPAPKLPNAPDTQLPIKEAGQKDQETEATAEQQAERAAILA